MELNNINSKDIKITKIFLPLNATPAEPIKNNKNGKIRKKFKK